MSLTSSPWPAGWHLLQADHAAGFLRRLLEEEEAMLQGCPLASPDPVFQCVLLPPHVGACVKELLTTCLHAKHNPGTSQAAEGAESLHPLPPPCSHPFLPPSRSVLLTTRSLTQPLKLLPSGTGSSRCKEAWSCLGSPMAKARECGSRGPRSTASGWTGPGCVTSRVCHLPSVSPPKCVPAPPLVSPPGR